MKPEELNNLSREDLEKRVNWYDKNYGPYFEERGLKNWKNLFRKPIMYEWVILVIAILIIIGGFTYDAETKTCRETLKNLPKEVCEACAKFQSFVANQSLEETLFNLSELELDLKFDS